MAYRSFRLGILPCLLTLSLAVDAAPSLYWRHQTSGDSYQYLLEQGQVQQQDFIRPWISPDWQIATKGDFDGDGNEDLLWLRPATGDTEIQTFRQGQHQQFKSLLRIPQPWQLAGSGDFNGDGTSDLLWQQPDTGEFYLFLMAANGIAQEQGLFRLDDRDWQLQAVADTDGNGRDELIFQHRTQGLVWRIALNGFELEQSEALFQLKDLNWQLQSMADLDGDQRDDMVWRHRLSGENYLILLHGSRVLHEQFAPTVADPQWHLKGLADLNDDGKAEWLWWSDTSFQLLSWQLAADGQLVEQEVLRASADWQLQFSLKYRPAIPSQPGTSYLTPMPSIPGRIEAEFYNTDGAGKAFADSTEANEGMALRTDAVDIEACTDQGGGHNVGYIARNEWLTYQVDVKRAGFYQLVARVAAQDTAGALHLELNGRNLTGDLDTPVTGGWQTWVSVTSRAFELPAGPQQLKLVFDGELFNLNYFELIEAAAPALAVPAALSATQQGQTLLLSWQATDGDGYQLERRGSEDSQWTLIAVTGTQYPDSALVWGQSYQYRVRSRSGERLSEPSPAITGRLQASSEQGKQRYASQCAACHGADGAGGPFQIPLNASCKTCADPVTLAKVIQTTMPKGQVGQCDAQCAQDIAAFIGSTLVNQPTEPVACGLSDLPTRSLRLLTRAEYQKTVEQLFGIDIDVSHNLPVEPRVRGYDNNAQVSIVTSRHIDEYLSSANEVAQWVASHKKMPFACAAGTSLSNCAQSFIPALGLRLFRRFLTQDENTRYQALFSQALTEGSIEQGMQLTLQAMLVSPSFLYRSEVGQKQADGRYRLTDFEIASSLSYLLWGSTPDETLLTEASQNRLNTPAQIQAQAQRLLAAPNAKTQLVRFASMWLDTDRLTSVNKDLSIYPAFTTEVREAMMAEFGQFVSDLVFEQGGRYRDLLISNRLWVNQSLASFYGLSGQFGAQLVSAVDPSGTRGGLLTLGAVLASHAHSNESSPIKRGKFVRDRLLCQDLPPPPPNLDTTPPGLDPTLTTRERFARHTSDAACSSCHQYIDSVGFGFEGFDGVGQFRPMENGLVVDQSGAVVGLERLTNGVSSAFNGPRELAGQIATSQAGPACMARQYYRFALGRSEQAVDECEISKLTQNFQTSGYSIQSLMLALIGQDAFIWRRTQE